MLELSSDKDHQTKIESGDSFLKIGNYKISQMELNRLDPSKVHNKKDKGWLNDNLMETLASIFL